MSQLKKNSFTLVNLGGPRNRQEIEVFLRDLFLDPYVFDLPLWEPLRKFIARYIARTRAPKVALTYESMGYGGGSPLVAETEKQAEALSHILQKKTGEEWIGYVSMACGFPNLRDHLIEENAPSKSHIHVPLFPQFSRSTILSLGSIYQNKIGNCPVGKVGWVDPFALDPRFTRLVAEFIFDFMNGNLETKNFPHFKNVGRIPRWETYHLVFSAHGIPMRLVEKGDRYVTQLEQMITEVGEFLKNLGFQGQIYLSYQSRIGRAKWTEPNTKDILSKLGGEKRNIAIFPISFVSDHLETLEEIGVELRDIALRAGAKSYLRIPAFGTYPKFINLIADLILESRDKKRNTDCLCLRLGGERLPSCHLD
ncbi:ferrochelatase [Leptospira ognonensis]|uniref:Ferrochelatase n=1 Tax=Leptospira ognonensis TaxID=2484945 RepID=A0A4R9JYG2_9LEPT|nr:ferrochelatase [Leptospira ognonensis]TGL56648.1 ferrochelatase [Leptospira ognonensis]